jgi:hypothetical protein
MAVSTQEPITVHSVIYLYDCNHNCYTAWSHNYTLALVVQHLTN